MKLHVPTVVRRVLDLFDKRAYCGVQTVFSNWYQILSTSFDEIRHSSTRNKRKYHSMSDEGLIDTSAELFEREMKYVYTNGIKVLKLADLAYDEKANHFYVKLTCRRACTNGTIHSNNFTTSLVVYNIENKFRDYLFI
jgi:hypothetical protein